MNAKTCHLIVLYLNINGEHYMKYQSSHVLLAFPKLVNKREQFHFTAEDMAKSQTSCTSIELMTVVMTDNDYVDLKCSTLFILGEA